MAKKKSTNVEAELKRILDEGSHLTVRTPSFAGEATGASIARFLEAVFRMNELTPQDAKLTDTMIVDWVKREFAGHQPTVATFSKRNPLATYRGKFNRGDILRSLPEGPARPRYLSVPYNEQGIPVRNQREMSKAEYLSAAAKSGLGVLLDEHTNQFIIQTLEHFGVVPVRLFGLKVTPGQSKKKPGKKLARA
jgi:hypothetical protein